MWYNLLIVQIQYGGVAMYLKKLKIKNWQCIDETEIKFENLMLFIGQSNSGKSSIMSAIMFFLGYRNFRSKDIRDEEQPLIIEGRFYNYYNKTFHLKNIDVSNKNIWLKVEKNLEEEARYFVLVDNRWNRISEKEYITITESTPLLYIPSFSDREQSCFFINSLLNILESKKINRPETIDEMIDTFNKLQSDYVSRGLYRNLIFEIFRSLAIYSKKKKHSLLDNSLIIFEEPELYLHPQKEKELFENMCLLTKLGCQIYVTTHSSNFINLYMYKSICIVRKEESIGTKVFQFKDFLFSGDEIKNFNMNYWINPDRGELFFAKKVILVEGQTDKIVLGYLSKRLGIYKYDYSILECGSKSLIPQFIKLLNVFKIPYVAVYDKDNHFWRTPEEIENSKQKNKTIKNSVNKEIGTWVEFENDIEEEIYQENRERKNYKNKPFYALKTVTDSKYVIPKRLEIKIRKIFS